jgi:hypothetical protein
MIRKALLGIIASALAATAALAQVNVVPQVGVTSAYLGKQTYSSAFFGLVPVSGGTDIVCIAGSATKSVRVQQIKIWGTAATAVQTLPLNLVRRTSADTGGTAASTTANPGVTTQIAKRETGNATATATLISYTANPTIVDSAPTYLDSQLLTMPIVTSAVSALPVDFNFAKDVENLLQAPLLSGAAAQLCVNIAGATITNAAAWNGSISWIEE